MTDMMEDPVVQRVQKTGHPKDPIPDCFPQPEAVDMFEDLESDVKWMISRYKRQRDMYKSHNLSTVDVDEFLGILAEHLEVIGELKKHVG